METIKKVYDLLKNREINPNGYFDNAGRFWLENSDLVDVREPSRSWPYSQMMAGRSLKYVKAVAKKFECQNDFDKLKSKV
jgi:hypothetical protein